MEGNIGSRSNVTLDIDGTVQQWDPIRYLRIAIRICANE